MPIINDSWIANARMYAINPAAAAAWRALFEWLRTHTRVPLKIMDYPAPAPLADLWQRADMGCVFMCGLPFARARPQPRIIAAPQPAGAEYKQRPVYRTHLVVRADSPYQTLEQTFGARLAYTVPDSQSGYHAVRHYLARFGQPRLYRQLVGPVINPAGALRVLHENKADIAPVDSYAWDLYQRFEPAALTGLRIIASTAWTPIPLLVAAPDCPADLCATLQTTLLGAADNSTAQPLLAALGLHGFSDVDAQDYSQLAHAAAEARQSVYPLLA